VALGWLCYIISSPLMVEALLFQPSRRMESEFECGPWYQSSDFPGKIRDCRLERMFFVVEFQQEMRDEYLGPDELYSGTARTQLRKTRIILATVTGVSVFAIVWWFLWRWGKRKGGGAPNNSGSELAEFSLGR